jgi:hypothetical protein
VQAFKDAVQTRDGRCVVSKVENRRARHDEWTGFKAVHIFPLAYEQQWKENNHGRWITVDPPQGGKINSVQNGILLRSHLHKEFDQYGFSINPDVSCPTSTLYSILMKYFQNGYKIVYFVDDLYRYCGSTLDRRLLDDPLCPPDSLFRWHFRQAVLSNMRGIAEPVYDDDFPPGSDMMGEILAGPKAAERMEFELFGRLACHTEIV